MCDQNRDPVNDIIAQKSIYLSIINVHCLLHFLGAMLFICVVNIPIKDIVNLISATLDEKALVAAYWIKFLAFCNLIEVTRDGGRNL